MSENKAGRMRLLLFFCFTIRLSCARGVEKLPATRPMTERNKLSTDILRRQRRASSLLLFETTTSPGVLLSGLLFILWWR